MRKIILILISVLLILICLSSSVFAELKSSYNIVEKLTEAEMEDGPRLYANSVYPGFGVPCTKFTYKVIYQDEKGRAPEYVRINLNNKWYDLAKKSGDYKSGVLYTYEYIPTSTKSNFFYFESSNGVGKARAAIIDSPDQGPTIYSEKFDNNQIVLLNKEGTEIWSYDTGYDQVEGVALSADGNYAAAVTNHYIYFFSTKEKEPLWKFCTDCAVPEIISTNMAGIGISADGSYLAADLQNKLYFFKKESNQPLWTKDTESSALGVDMSDDGNLIALGVANMNGKGDKIFLYNKEGSKLWEYRAEHPGYDQTGNFYHPDMTPDGKYIAISTGCPDRRAYLFSREGDLLFRSEQLTYDSPVHKSAISDDGTLIAYSADHNTGKEIVFLFNKEGKKLWSFSSPDDSTARAVSISADGKYIAAGTSAGHVYLFSKESNKPLWKFTDSAKTQIGEVKLNPDGSLLAAAGTSKKIYLFSKEGSKPLWEYKTNTWVTKLDFNGEYILAGTGLREYGGEGTPEEKEFACTEIIEPPTREDYSEQEDQQEIDTESSRETVCGNDLCESPKETFDNCPQDCCGENCEDKLGITEELKDREEIEKDISNEEKEFNVKKNEEVGFFERIINWFRKLFS